MWARICGSFFVRRNELCLELCEQLGELCGQVILMFLCYCVLSFETCAQSGFMTLCQIKYFKRALFGISSPG